MAENKAKAESINLADIQAQVKVMLDNAKAEAEKIIADAKAATSGELTDEQKEAKAKRAAYWNEEIPIELFKDNNKYKDDVFVAVNGENCVIKRGEKVMVKRKFANALDLSSYQDKATSKLIEQKSGEANSIN